ncbi:methyltransferase, FxLD system [Actinoplanes sp. RD1]|uniref:methyltransferase, FxLD system n=1 Tax=Actinoplanes sp. RD1 TaxID=3064538 RepID=UPI0027410E6C|nr:methyltransferase, FxLD system [Actinoplanes sp. RD1]
MDTDPTTPDWRQINLTCLDWRAAEHVAFTTLRPLLTAASEATAIDSWWFIRKGDTWRVRVQSAIPQFIDEAILLLSADAKVRDCGAAIYEPETAAFGGNDGMTVAHHLFHADSRFLLEHLATARDTHRRELPLILATRLMRGAGLEPYEQGDCWAQLAEEREASAALPPGTDLADAVRHLVTATTDTPVSPLSSTPAWADAFDDAGHRLARLAADGDLTRGLRAVLTHHLIFLFNRHGVSAQDQHQLAAAARNAFFGPPPQPVDTRPSSTATGVGATTVATVTDTDDNRTAHLRNDLTDWIKSRGTFHTPTVEAAFRAVERHRFLPDVPLEVAYGRKPVVTQRADDGTSTSSASSPNLVATMLEQLGARDTQKVLEVGAATGINAALLAHLVGDGGTVVTIEFDPDLAAGAARHLTDAGYTQVHVIAGDGALGHADLGPYDRIIVTAEAWDIPPAWWDQLAADGRIVVPLRLHGSGLTRSLALDLTEPGLLTSTSAVVCGFVPMRGTTEHADQHIPLADDVMMHVDAGDLPDSTALAGALTQPRHEVWTGIEVRHDEPAEHLDLWLLTNTADRFGRLTVTPTARQAGIDPALRWGGAALYDTGTVAYLITRDVNDDVVELGVAASGPDAGKLATAAVDLLHQWDQQRPTQPKITARRTTAGDPDPSAPHLVRPHTTITISW